MLCLECYFYCCMLHDWSFLFLADVGRYGKCWHSFHPCWIFESSWKCGEIHEKDCLEVLWRVSYNRFSRCFRAVDAKPSFLFRICLDFQRLWWSREIDSCTCASISFKTTNCALQQISTNCHTLSKLRHSPLVIIQITELSLCSGTEIADWIWATVYFKH